MQRLLHESLEIVVRWTTGDCKDCNVQSKQACKECDVASSSKLFSTRDRNPHRSLPLGGEPITVHYASGAHVEMSCFMVHGLFFVVACLLARLAPEGAAQTLEKSHPTFASTRCCFFVLCSFFCLRLLVWECRRRDNSPEVSQAQLPQRCRRRDYLTSRRTKRQAWARQAGKCRCRPLWSAARWPRA